MSHIKLISQPLQIKVGHKVMTGYRGHIVAAKVVMVDYHNNRYVLEFITPTTGHVVMCRQRHQIDQIDDATIVTEVNIENEEAEEFVHLEMM